MSIHVVLDATNPGQYFACCGLLEFADRLHAGAEAWFANDDREFHLNGTGTLSDIVQAIADFKGLQAKYLGR